MVNISKSKWGVTLKIAENTLNNLKNIFIIKRKIYPEIFLKCSENLFPECGLCCPAAWQHLSTNHPLTTHSLKTHGLC